MLPQLSNHTLVGTAQATPVAGPPAVGDCVIEPIDPGPGILGGSLSGAGAFTYPQLQTSPCRAGRYGEITELVARPSKPVVTGSGSDLELTDANLSKCWKAAYRYMGIPVPDQQSGLQGGTWYPLLTVAAVATGPSIRQQAAGQHWLACVAYLPGADGNLATVKADQRYDTSIRNALFTGQQRDRTGRCIAGADLTGQDVPRCNNIHQSELFGVGTTGHHPMNRKDLHHSCQQLITQLTHIGDVTADGFTAQMVATDNGNTTITTPTIPAESNLACGLTSKTRPLNGSLLALGNQPIPWA